MSSCKALLSIFLLIAMILLISVAFYPMAYLYATYENLYGEWLQFSAFVALSYYSLLIVRHKLEPIRWCWLLLAVLAFYVAGEEVSWGQQLFGWQSSAFFQAQNLQGETNLHNMLTGPYSTLLKDALTYGLSLGIFSYGALYPWLLRFDSAIARRIERLGVPAPSVCLSPVFALAAMFELALFHFNETEVAELLVALAMCFVAAQTYYGDTIGNEQALGKKYVQLMAVLLIVAFSLTQVSLYSSGSKERVANRIESGTKKFAGRYARVEAWGHAINLYQRHLAYAPQSRSRLRRLARAYKHAGRTVDYRLTMQTALGLDLAQLEEERWRASLHRSLYKTYRELNNYDKADMHLGRALAINEDRLAESPSDASAVYSLALTLDLMGYEEAAIEQYGRAVELEPTRKKYRRAYRDAIY